MVCIYCTGETRVSNSRLQKRSNQIWRRRTCNSCSAVFTTTELPQLHTSLLVEKPSGVFEPFIREKLYISLLQALKGRPGAYLQAAELSTTVIASLLREHPAAASIPRSKIINKASLVLKRFNRQAYMRYIAEHSPDTKA